MNTTLIHLALAAVGVGVVFTLAMLLRQLASKDAVLRYRVMVGALLLACAIIPIQALAAEFAPAPSPRTSRAALHIQAGIIAAPAPAPIAASATIDLSRHVPPAPPQATNPAAPTRTRDLFTRVPAPSLLLSIYLIGVCIVLSILGIRTLAIRRLLQSARPVTDQRVLRILTQLVESTDRRPKLLESGSLHAPACCNFGKATIILPLGSGELDDCTLKAIFKHELIHLRRHDGAIAAVAAAITTLLWFQPLVWVFAHLLRADREHSCDALVVRATRQPRSYALALLQFCGPASNAHRATSLIGFESARSMRRRITMLAHASQPAPRSHHAIAIGAGLACLVTASVAHALLTAMAGPGPALADDSPIAVAAASGATNEARPPQSTSGQPAPAQRMTAEVRATADGRSDEHVYARLVKQGAIAPRLDPRLFPGMQADDAPKFVAASARYPTATVIDQATVLAVKAANIDGNILRAGDVRLSLPDGSKLRVVFEGQSVITDRDTGGVNRVNRVVVTGGTLRLVDDQGFTRVEARADSDREAATLTLTSVAQEGELAFNLVATDGTNPVPIRMDVRTGVAEPSPENIHGSASWKLLVPAPAQATPAQGIGELKIQWTYEINKLESSVGADGC